MTIGCDLLVVTCNALAWPNLWSGLKQAFPFQQSASASGRAALPSSSSKLLAWRRCYWNSLGVCHTTVPFDKSKQSVYTLELRKLELDPVFFVTIKPAMDRIRYVRPEMSLS